MNEDIVVTPKDTGVEVNVERTETVESVDYTPIQGMLNVTEPTTGDKDALKDVWAYFNPDGKKSAAEVMWAVRDVESKLQPARMGETRLAKIYEYVKLRKNIENDERLLKLL